MSKKVFSFTSLIVLLLFCFSLVFFLIPMPHNYAFADDKINIDLPDEQLTKTSNSRTVYTVNPYTGYVQDNRYLNAGFADLSTSDMLFSFADPVIKDVVTAPLTTSQEKLQVISESVLGNKRPNQPPL